MVRNHPRAIPSEVYVAEDRGQVRRLSTSIVSPTLGSAEGDRGGPGLPSVAVVLEHLEGSTCAVHD